MMTTLSNDQVLHLIEQLGIVRPAELETRGIPRTQLYRLVRDGRVARRC